MKRFVTAQEKKERRDKVLAAGFLSPLDLLAMRFSPVFGPRLDLVVAGLIVLLSCIPLGYAAYILFYA
jgi:hypothetical protein